MSDGMHDMGDGGAIVPTGKAATVRSALEKLFNAIEGDVWEISSDGLDALAPKVEEALRVAAQVGYLQGGFTRGWEENAVTAGVEKLGEAP